MSKTSILEMPFMGADVAVDYQAAKVVILPIPYEATTTYRLGCEHGPEAILAASQQVEYYDEELDKETCCEVGIYTHEAIADTRSSQVTAEQMLQVTQETVYKLISDNKFVIALGGEHSITTGVVEAYRHAVTALSNLRGDLANPRGQAYPNEAFTVVQIDAHGDLRHEYEGTIHNHACIMRRVVDMGLPTVQIGIRAICKEEADLIKAKNLTVFRAREIAANTDWIEKAIASIPTQKVFLTIDLDGIDPTLIPGVGTPEPGGLSWYAITTFLRQVFATHQVIGCDVMELAPIVDSVVSQFTAAKLVYKLIGYQAFVSAQGAG